MQTRIRYGSEIGIGCCVLCPAWPPSVRKHELTTLLAIGIADLVKRIKPRVLVYLVWLLQLWNGMSIWSTILF